MATDNTGRSDLRNVADVDRLIHELARLMILASLYVVESADSTFLLRQTGLRQANLPAYTAELGAAGHIDAKEESVDMQPHTMLHITEKGRAAFQAYWQRMAQVFDDLSL